MNSEFSIQAEEIGRVHVVTVSGEVDATAVKKLEETLKSFGRIKPLHAVVDAQGLTLLNSRAVSLLVQFHRYAEANGGRCVFAGFTPEIRERLTSLIGLGYLEFFDSRQEAMDTFF